MIQTGMMALMMAGSFWPVKEWLEDGALPFVYLAICLSGISGIVAYVIVYRGISASIRMFTSYIIGSMMAKMMVGIASTTLIALKFEDFAKEYVLVYFFCYFIFTSFELYSLMRKLRPISKTGKRNTHEKDPGK